MSFPLIIIWYESIKNIPKNVLSNCLITYSRYSNQLVMIGLICIISSPLRPSTVSPITSKSPASSVTLLTNNIFGGSFYRQTHPLNLALKYKSTDDKASVRETQNIVFTQLLFEIMCCIILSNHIINQHLPNNSLVNGFDIIW